MTTPERTARAVPPAPPDRRTDALAELFETRREPMARLAYVLTRNAEVADELVQDAFLQLHRNWDRVEQPVAYLRTAVVNGCHSHHRHLRVVRSAPVHRELSTAEPIPFDDELDQALERLPFEQRAVLVLRYLDDLDDVQIADALGIDRSHSRSPSARPHSKGDRIMKNDLETRLADHYDTIAEQFELGPISLDEALAMAESRVPEVSSVADVTRRSIPTWLQVAALAIVVVGGLALIVDRVADSPSEEIEAPAPLLGDVEEIGADQWVVASRLPDGLAWSYALDARETDGARILRYGTADDVERLEVVLDPNGDALAVDSSVAVIAGTEWELLTPGSGRWTALTQVGATTVRITDSGPFDDQDEELLAGLVVVVEEDLPFPPLGGPERAIDVARFERAGETQVVAVQVSNGFRCTWVSSDQGMSGGCGSVVGTPDQLTVDGGSTSVGDGAATAEVTRAGSAPAGSARVEVEFGDGTVVSVTPTDLSGQFDRLFWIASAVVPVDDRAFVEARSFDADGRLVASDSDPAR